MMIKEFLKGTPTTVRPQDDLALALQMMVWGEIRHLPVMEGDSLVGVLSERDVLRHYADAGRQVGAREKVAAVMSSPAATVSPNDDVAAAVKLVVERGIGCVPVAEQGRLVGLLTRRDLLEHEGDAGLTAPESRPSDEPTPEWANRPVDEVMNHEPLTASADETMRDAIVRMGTHGIRHLPVVDESRRVIGMLSDRDVRTVVGNPMLVAYSRGGFARIESMRVAQAMTRAPLTLPTGTTLWRVAAFFAHHKVGAAPVVDANDAIVGIVSLGDLLRVILGHRPARQGSTS